MKVVHDSSQITFSVGNLVNLRGREWIIVETPEPQTLKVRPLAGGMDRSRLIHLPLETDPPKEVCFSLPNPQKAGPQYSAMLMKDACRLRLRSGAGPFRSFSSIRVEPRAYQLVPLMMALTHRIIRLLIADDVGIGKTIEAGLIVKELLERGEITRFTILCSPSLCDQWEAELQSKFLIDAQIVKSSTISRLEREIPSGQSLFEYYPYTIVSLDYIKSRRYRDEFQRTCPDFVIVDEAHTCVLGSSNGQHLRYELLKKLANDPERHIVMLTATPHSGNEEAFYNLLCLLDPDFHILKELGPCAQRDTLRERLARHFVQRRRADIQEWRESSIFPDRLSNELSYNLSDPMKKFIREIKDLTKKLILSNEKNAENKTPMIHWWSALALLRAAGSSPAAVEDTLSKKITYLSNLDCEESPLESKQHYLFDGDSDSSENTHDDLCHGLQPDPNPEINVCYSNLLSQIPHLKGIENDRKLAATLNQVKQWIQENMRPIIFCRFQKTAEYLGTCFRENLPKTVNVQVVTGILNHEQREQIIKSMADEMENKVPVLIATDCLSEGINLQQAFNAVIHYDLPWNPNRLEQREGRVDRFGQPSSVVKTLLVRGQNNPVDEAVLEVILRKAESIRKELGIHIPVLEDSDVICKALLERILHHPEKKRATIGKQLELGVSYTEENLMKIWESAKDKAKESRTMFAQKGLNPEQVLPEWQKMQNALGDQENTLRFLKLATERLGAPLETIGNKYKLPIEQLPEPVRVQLDMQGYSEDLYLCLAGSSIGHVEVIHRSHPVILALADHLAECALILDDPNLAARSSAFHTNTISKRQCIYLLRIRYLMESAFTDGKRKKTHKSQLVEEIISIQQIGQDLTVLEDSQLNELLNVPVIKNMTPERRVQIIEQGIDRFQKLENEIQTLAKNRAVQLKSDHTRVRSASQVESRKTPWTCSVAVTGKPDLLGIFILEPIPMLH